VKSKNQPQKGKLSSKESGRKEEKSPTATKKEKGKL